MKILVRFLYAVSILGALGGALAMFITLQTSGSAPQEAAGAAIALAITVIPYCLARAAQEMYR